MADAEALLAAGDPSAALKALQPRVRERAADAKLRTFLFQLLAVLGQWPRALDQLKVCGELDASTLAMVNTYSAAVQCERVREAVFAGSATPHVFGPPTDWIAQLAQALQLDAQGQAAQAATARAAALDAAPASRGRLNDTDFEWIADADSRLGPTLEGVINGRYGWLPFEHVSELAIEPVVDLRDLIWAPAQLTFANGAGTVCLLPVRYPGTAAQPDGALQLARKTEWLELADGQYRGLGQRVIATDSAELGLLQVKSLTIHGAAAA